MSVHLDDEVDEDDDDLHQTKKRKLNNDFAKPMPRPNIFSSSFATGARPALDA